MSIQHLGKIEQIDIFWDPHSINNSMYFGRKNDNLKWNGFKKLLVGYRYIFINEKEYEVDTTAGDDFIKKLQNPSPKFKDFDYVVGSFSTLNLYYKSIELLKKSCQK